MKSVYLLAIVNLLLLTQDANGGFLGDLADLGKEIRENVHKDIQRLIHKGDRKEKDPVVEYVTKPTQEEKKEVVASVTTPIPSTTTKVNDIVPQDNQKPNPEAKVDTGKIETTTDKGEGKENFKGGCATNFKMTPDGRCMPTF